MTPRERLIAALDRRAPDRLPKNMTLTAPALATFQVHVGATDYASYFGLESRLVSSAPTRVSDDFSRYLPDLPEGAVVTERGLDGLRREMVEECR